MTSCIFVSECLFPGRKLVAVNTASFFLIGYLDFVQDMLPYCLPVEEEQGRNFSTMFKKVFAYNIFKSMSAAYLFTNKFRNTTVLHECMRY